MQSYTVLQLVLIDESGDSYYRMRWPARELAEQQPGWRVINLDAAAQERFEWGVAADLLVLYQAQDLEMIPVMLERKRLGKKTLVEYNDNFYQPQPWSPVAKEWSSPLVWQNYELIMQLADGIIVTGSGLKEILIEHGQPAEKISILQNYLHQAPATFKDKSSSTKNLSIGWAGSLGHMADLLSVTPVLQRLALKHSAQIHLMGNSSIPELVQIPAKQLSYTAWGSIFDYYKFWEPVQIGIVPLIDTAYNRGRSDIKAVEIAAASALPLLPDFAIYRDFLEQTGIEPYRSKQELLERIIFYQQNPTILAQETKRTHEYVLNQRLGLKNTTRYNLYLQSMPKELSKYDWSKSMTTGCHELKGTEIKVTASASNLAKIRTLIIGTAYQEAMNLVLSELSANPFHPDLALLHLQLLTVTKNSNLNQVLDLYLSRFSKDHRFRLLSLQICPKEKRQDAWGKYCSYLKNLASPAQEFALNDTLKIFKAQLIADQTLLEKADQLLEIYPESAELRFLLAQHSESAGLFDQAYLHYSFLSKQLKNFKQNQAFLGQVELGYVLAWEEALKDRCVNEK